MKDNRADAPTTVRPYRPEDLEACRALWVELTEWHRQIYRSPDIGGPDPGRHFDEHLHRVGPDHVWVADAGGWVVGLAGLIPGEGEKGVSFHFQRVRIVSRWNNSAPK